MFSGGGGQWSQQPFQSTDPRNQQGGNTAQFPAQNTQGTSANTAAHLFGGGFSGNDPFSQFTQQTPQFPAPASLPTQLPQAPIPPSHPPQPPQQHPSYPPYQQQQPYYQQPQDGQQQWQQQQYPPNQSPRPHTPPYYGAPTPPSTSGTQILPAASPSPSQQTSQTRYVQQPSSSTQFSGSTMMPQQPSTQFSGSTMTSQQPSTQFSGSTMIPQQPSTQLSGSTMIPQQPSTQFSGSTMIPQQPAFPYTQQPTNPPSGTFQRPPTMPTNTAQHPFQQPAIPPSATVARPPSFSSAATGPNTAFQAQRTPSIPSTPPLPQPTAPTSTAPPTQQVWNQPTPPPPPPPGSTVPLSSPSSASNIQPPATVSPATPPVPPTAVQETSEPTNEFADVDLSGSKGATQSQGGKKSALLKDDFDDDDLLLSKPLPFKQTSTVTSNRPAFSSPVFAPPLAPMPPSPAQRPTTSTPTTSNAAPQNVFPSQAPPPASSQPPINPYWQPTSSTSEPVAPSTSQPEQVSNAANIPPPQPTSESTHAPPPPMFQSESERSWVNTMYAPAKAQEVIPTQEHIPETINQVGDTQKTTEQPAETSTEPAPFAPAMFTQSTESFTSRPAISQPPPSTEPPAQQPTEIHTDMNSMFPPPPPNSQNTWPQPPPATIPVTQPTQSPTQSTTTYPRAPPTNTEASTSTPNTHTVFPPPLAPQPQPKLANAPNLPWENTGMGSMWGPGSSIYENSGSSIYGSLYPDGKAAFQPEPQPPPQAQTSPLPPATPSTPPTPSAPAPPSQHTPAPTQPQPPASSMRQQQPAPPQKSKTATDIEPHWFHYDSKSGRWLPYVLRDSQALEAAFTQAQGYGRVMVDGGRYDVDVFQRKQHAVFWEEQPAEVVRATWYTTTADEVRPYSEMVAAALELEFKVAYMSGAWGRRVDIDSGECVVMHSEKVMAHYVRGEDHKSTARTAVRGFDKSSVEEGTDQPFDHLFLVVGGLGASSDPLGFVEATNCMRAHAKVLGRTHFEAGDQIRAEFLPVVWRHNIPLAQTVDTKLSAITPRRVRQLRTLINDATVDLSFFTSPETCQSLCNALVHEINRVYHTYLARHPNYTGGVSVVGHALASVLAFDILAYQGTQKQIPTAPTPPPQGTRPLERSPSNPTDTLPLQRSSSITSAGGEEEAGETKAPPRTPSREGDRDLQLAAAKKKFLKKKTSVTKNEGMPGSSFTPNLAPITAGGRTGYTPSSEGVGQPAVSYPDLAFSPWALFVIGSPLGLYLALRGTSQLGATFNLPTCPRFFNVFHPYDPMAYRLEPFLDSSMSTIEPLQLAHHKGRKRMHLELWEQGRHLVTSLRTQIMGPREEGEATGAHAGQAHGGEARRVSGAGGEVQTCASKLNGGQRVDYVLQEAPLESINEYLFSISSHHCYWQSEDTVLFLLTRVNRERRVAQGATVNV